MVIQYILVIPSQFVLKNFGRLSKSMCSLFNQFMHKIDGKKRVWRINENSLYVVYAFESYGLSSHAQTVLKHVRMYI